MDWFESPDAPLLGDGRKAVAVDRPESVESLRECVVRRVSEGHAIYPQGGRTALDYGGTPRRPGVVVDMTAINGVIDYPAADMTVTVSAGITLSKLQEILGTEGQFLPLDAPFSDRATLGGIYATNTCGPRRFGWGRPRDLIIGVSFVTADGQEIKGGGRVVKNVAGYDFPKMMTGSMGTLGILTQMTLKTRPKPGASALVAIPFEDETELLTAIVRLNTSETRPVAIEVLNQSACRSCGVDLPKAAWVLAVGLEDNQSSVSWQIERLLSEVGRSRTHCLVQEGEPAVPFWNGLTEFPARTIGQLSCSVSLARSKAMPLALAFAKEDWTVKVQPASGIIEAHLSAEIPFETVHQRVETLRSAVEAAGGSLVLTRCPSEWKERLKVWGSPRGEWALMERIKSALDPASVLNPGRFVGTI